MTSKKKGSQMTQRGNAGSDAKKETSQITSQNLEVSGVCGARTAALAMDNYERETYRRSVAYGRARGQI